MHFVNEPKKQTFSPMPIIVCKAGQTLRVICLTKRMAGVETHWFGGHTIACCGTANCIACQANYAPVWKGYFVGWDGLKDVKGLILVTDGAYEPFGQFVNHEKGFVGLRITITRQGRRDNSPMVCQISGRDKVAREYDQTNLVSMVTRIFAANAQKVPNLD